jgi:hypothetical protein
MGLRPGGGMEPTNFNHGIEVDPQNLNGLDGEKYIAGTRHTVQFPQIAAADMGKTFWIAPHDCKVINAWERHVTVAGQAGTMQIEKVPSGTAIGSGTVVLASAFDLTSTANTAVKKDALTTSAAVMAAGDSLATKLASGAATSYAAGTLEVTLEWL